jgi:cytosine/adenosine deaminase-related metal-dependent hydrolase
LIRTGEGPWRELLQQLGTWSDEWKPPGTTPVAYLADAGFLDERVLIVHAVQCTAADLARLARLGCTIVSCPRSNRHVGVGSPPLDAFYAAGVDVAFGTDSLASVDDLNVFAELAEARRLAPRVPASRLLESATRTGARALGFDGEFGSIEAGKRAALLAVSLPAGVADVEEYLLSGINPQLIRWLDAR